MDAVQICPRCGYDLSGAVAAWEDCCPLTGVCSECGLEHRWADVLNPMLTAPRWSFEHASGRLALRLGQTCLWGLAPWVVWKRLRMEHPVNRRRLGLLALAWAVAAHLALGLGAMAQNYQQALLSGSATSTSEALYMALPALGWPYAEYTWYGTGWLAWQAPRPVNMATVLATAPLVMAPVTFLLLPASLRRAKVRRAHLLRGAACSAAVFPAMALVWSSLVAWAAMGKSIWVLYETEYLALGSVAIVAGGFAWQWVYWRFFAACYLRLPHSGVVAFVMLAIPVLLVVTLVALLDGGAALNWLDGLRYWLERAGESLASGR